MFSQKKLATISLLLGGLSAVGLGIGHADAAAPSGNCTRDAQGNVTCVSKSESTYVSEDGRYHVQQTQECSTVSREEVNTPQTGVGQKGTTQIGASVSCSNNAPAPEGFKAPDVSR